MVIYTNLWWYKSLMVTCEFISYKICKLLVTAPLVQWHTSPVHRATTEQLFTNISCLRNEQMPIWRPHYSTGVQQVHIKYCHPNVCFRYKMAGGKNRHAHTSYIVSLCICVFVYLCTCVFVYLCICVFVYLCICEFVYLYT